MRKLLLAFAVLGLAAASAKTYDVKLYQPTMLGSTELKPGEYKLQLDGNHMVITDGKRSGEATVKVENEEKKFGNTLVRLSNGDGKYRIQEIHLGGTRMKLIVSD